MSELLGGVDKTRSRVHAGPGVEAFVVSIRSRGLIGRLAEALREQHPHIIVRVGPQAEVKLAPNQDLESVSATKRELIYRNGELDWILHFDQDDKS